MKLYNYIFLSLIGLLISQVIVAQEVNNGSILLKGLVTESDLRLRWIPDDYSLWQSSMVNGYTLERTTIAINDVASSVQDIIDSKTVLTQDYVPYTSSQFDQHFPASDSAAHVVKMILYDTNLEPEISENRNLADAVAYQDNIESKYLFTMLISEGSYDIAQALALGYQDNNVTLGQTYLYRLALDIDGDTLTQEITMKYTGNLEMPAPSRLLGEGQDLAVKLGWDIKSTNSYYNLFKIQRSEDNVNFQTVNSVPFTYVSEIEENPERAYYEDAVPENKKPFYYRIIGRSPFGIDSAPSDTVMVTGIPAKLDMAITIDSLYETDAGTLRVDWRSIANVYNNKIERFDIYTKASVDDQEIKLNSQPINPNQRTFDRINAPSDAYYRLEATDINGHIYTTLSYAGQVVDKTPPAAPQSTKGKILRDGTVVLSWSDNAEEDLLGYKVFYSNVKNGEYSTTVTEVNRDTFQIGNIDTSMDTDSIFYKVAAYDDRYNRSNFSEIISLARPDDVAPGKPLIAQIAARPAGIKISWILSNTPDVSQYTLQRKTVESTTWNDILSFSADDIPDPLPQGPSQQIVTNYIDQDPLDLRYYNYRLLAEDNFDNQSASPIKTVKPYDNLIRGIVQEFDASMNAVQNTNSQTSGNNSIVSTIGSTYDSEGIQITNAINSNVKLSWQYRSSNISPLKEFKVYMQTYKPGDPQMGEIPYILVNTISENKAETIALTQGYNGYMYVHNLAHIPGLQYNLKIMAYHTDGGFSEFTDSMAVPH